MYPSSSDPPLKAVLGGLEGPAVHLWKDMWDGKNMVKVKVEVRRPSRSFYQLGYSQALLAFLFIPGFHGVPGITGSWCSTFEENLQKSQSQGH